MNAHVGVGPLVLVGLWMLVSNLHAGISGQPSKVLFENPLAKFGRRSWVYPCARAGANSGAHSHESSIVCSL